MRITCLEMINLQNAKFYQLTELQNIDLLSENSTKEQHCNRKTRQAIKVNSRICPYREYESKI
jgi:hypothetical protein